MQTQITRALISVSDKRGIVEFARGLSQLGVEILSTGGTARELTNNNIKVVQVSDYTGFPELMGGRVKTLHPKIHGGILARRATDGGGGEGGDEDDSAEMAAHDIAPIDLVAVNLYPFMQTITTPGSTHAHAIESIDIGGPALLRAAAKNHRFVTAICDAADYPAILAALRENGRVSGKMRRRLAAKAFAHTAVYEAEIVDYFEVGRGDPKMFPRSFRLYFRRKQLLRYGENPHQAAAFYMPGGTSQQPPIPVGIASAKQLQGKDLSFNNIADADAALQCAVQFGDGARGHACVIVKHANPCGVGLSGKQLAAYQRALACDAESAFGGIIAFNSRLDAPTAKAIVGGPFTEVVLAPAIVDSALEIFKSKPDLRVLEVQDMRTGMMDYRGVGGNLLVQRADTDVMDDFTVVSAREPSENEHEAMMLAWATAKFVKSNAIVYADSGGTLGIGAGQMSRVQSARIAGERARQAGYDLQGAAMASDAFLPFADALETAAAAGVTAVIQPGGSKRDAEVIAAADANKMAMVFTGMRHFRH